LPSKIKILLSISDDIVAIALAITMLWSFESYKIISVSTAFIIGVPIVSYFVFVAFKTYKLQSIKPKVGTEIMIGKKGKTISELNPEGIIEVEGEHWKAVSDTPIRKGVFIEVVKIEGLKITVIQAEAK
jgi:membrane-bound serine protease (ClpP class)